MMPALARAAAAASHAPGAARYVFVGSRLEQRGDVVGELNRLARESKMMRGGASGGAATEGGKAAEGEEEKMGGDAAAAEGAEEETFNTFGTYGTAKQAGTALTYELARRVEAAAATSGVYGGSGGDCCGVAIHACTPGMVNTNLGRFVGPVLQTLVAPLQWRGWVFPSVTSS
jgi:hypothetical protein